MNDDPWEFDQEERARSRGVDAHFGGRVLLGAFINDGLDYLIRRGVPPPARVVVDPGRFEGHPLPAEILFGAFDADTETIYLNPNSRYFGFAPESAEQLARMHFNMGEWSTESPHHVLLHELGHERYYRMDPVRYRSIRQLPLPNEALRAGFVSERATRNVVEFVAEVFAALVVGECVHEDMLEWYRDYGGPIP